MAIFPSLSPPAKRKRLVEIPDFEFDESDMVSLSEDTVERSTEFWFDDGNVVLQAEDTQFRVHRSVLSRHSVIMQDCLDCPQPEDAPTIQGCPLIHLADLAKDIDNMCNLLYGMYHVDAKNITSSYLQTMLFMGRKYEIASFTASAKNILRQLFPSTLELWDRCQPDLTRLTSRNYGFLFDVFNMVCEYPIPSVMQPLLISLCTTHSLHEISLGITRGDQPWAILRLEAKQYCIVNRLAFMQFALRKLLGSFRDSNDVYALPVEKCHSKTKCLDCLRRTMTDIVMKHTSSHTAAFPQKIATSHGESSFCPACAARLRELFRESRQAVWNKLPSVLRVFENSDFA